MPHTPIHGNTRPNFHDIQQHLSNTDPRLGEKHLRLDEHRGLHLHDTGKPSGIGPQALRTRQEKHQRAFDQVVEAINRQLRRTEGGKTIQIGNGEDVLRDVLGERSFQNKQIRVNDLGRIAARLDEVERAHRDALLDQVVDSFAQHLGQDDPGLEQMLRQKLKDAPFPSGIKPDILRRFAKSEGDWQTSPPLHLDSLRADLDRLGPWQALAQHGLIHATVQNHSFGTAYQQLTVPDSEGFAGQALRDALRTRPGKDCPHREIIGQHGKAEAQGGFFHYHTHDLAHCVETGDKVHISIAPDQVEKAWDVIAPILIGHPDVVKQFKLTDLQATHAEIARLDSEIAMLETEREFTAPDSERHDQISQQLAVLRRQREAPQRVHEGAQITIYSHQPQDGEPIAPERFQQVIAQITEALRQQHFEPGRRPASDLPVNDFVTYRNDKTENGGDLRPEHPRYNEYLEQMKGRPIYLALAHPDVAGAASELYQLSQRIQANEEIRGRRNDDGSITLYGSRRKPSLFSQLTGQAAQRRELGRQALEGMLARFEAALGNSARPATRAALTELRARMQAGPLSGAAFILGSFEQTLHLDDSRALQHGWNQTAQRETEATRRTQERTLQVRDMHKGRIGERIELLGQEIRAFDPGTLRATQTQAQGQGPGKRSATDGIQAFPPQPLPRQQMADDIVEPGANVIRRGMAGTAEFLDISQQLLHALSTGDVSGRQTQVLRLGQLIAGELQQQSRATQLNLTLGTGQAIIDGLANAMARSWPPHDLHDVLTDLVGQAHLHALAQLADRMHDDGRVTVDGKTYARQSTLSESGFGRVDLYQAEDGTQIVLKTPARNEQLTLAQQLESARSEVRAHRAAQDDGAGNIHPLVIGYRGAMRGPDGLVRIAIDYAPGGNLNRMTERIDQAQKNGDISPQAAMTARITLLRDIVEGMRHVQEARGMLHLDLKPINFFIGADGRAKVGDFGTSHVGDSLRMERGLVDNPRWQAPEIITGLKTGAGLTVDGQSDIWALGITAYQLFHEGALLFDHPRFMSAISNQLAEFGAHDDNRVRAQSLKPGDEQGVTALDRLLNRMLHPKPQERPSLGQVLESQLFLEPGVGDRNVRALIRALSTDNLDQAREISRRMGV